MIEGLLSPGALVAAALAIPILLVYMLRARRQRHEVPSTFLWREATRNVAATRPWERLRASVLLLLQLLALAALVIALARPYVSAPGVAGTHLIVLVDASASMLASDVSSSRLDAARREATRLIETASEGTTISVVSASFRPRVVVASTQDKRAAAEAVHRIEATEAPADMSEAFLMAESLEVPGRPATIALVSDGGLTPEERRLVPEGTVFRSVGTVEDNVSIESAHVVTGRDGYGVLLRVRNHGRADRAVAIVVDREGGRVGGARLTVPGHGVSERSVPVGAEGGRITARVTTPDALMHDNVAYAVAEQPRERSIVLVSHGNVFLEALLTRLPNTDLRVTASPRDIRGADIAVFDRIPAPRTLAVPALHIAPAKPPPGVRLLGRIDKPTISFLAVGDPLLEDVDLSDVAIATSQRVRIAAARTVVGTEGSPLVATWTRRGRRNALVSFDLHASNLPLQIAFPLLFEHLVRWLGGDDQEPARYAGDRVVPAPLPGAREVRVRGPGGVGEVLLPGAALTSTARAGFYEIAYVAGDRETASRTVALNFPPSESVIRPRDVDAPASAERPGLTQRARRPVVAWILALALLVLLVEWWWAHGRPGWDAIIARALRRRAA